MTNEETVYHFYKSLNEGNVDAMLSCYHPEIVFEDPIFGELHGERAMHMWRMLLKRPNSKLRIKVENVHQIRGMVMCLWTAKYEYGKNKRKVYNVVESQFMFKGSKVFEHRDSFHTYMWIKQALGMMGFLFGWSNWYQDLIKKQANRHLDSYIKKQANSK